MDAIFINPFPGGDGLSEATVEPPLGLAYLASMLEQRGFACSIIDANALKLDSSQVMQAIPIDIKLIGFHINSFNYNSVKELVAICRELLPGTVLLLGGPLASAIPQQLLSEIPCHGLIRGEGEQAVVRIMENINRGKPPLDTEVPGAVFYDPESKEVILNPTVRIKDLDQIPFPAYHLLPPLKVYKSRTRKKPMAAIVTSRGCPYQCIFCSQDVFQRQITFRSAENVLGEIDYLVECYGVQQIDILDDNFTQKRSRVEEILDGLLERNYDLVLNLQSGIRTEVVDLELLMNMKKAGVFKVGFGIESADPDVLRICCKWLDLKKAEEVIKAAKKVGLLVYGFFIIGLPGETEEAFTQTLEFAKRMEFDVANFCMAVPFVGTELHRMVEARGRFLIDTSRNIGSGFHSGDVFYEYCDAKKEDIQRRYKKAYKEFYTLSKKLRMLAKIQSWSELCWHFNAARFALKGIAGSRFKGLSEILNRNYWLK